MLLLILVTGLLLLILLIVRFKMNPFLAFLIVALGLGISTGIPLENIVPAIQKGMGDILGSLLVLLCLGAMLGKLVAESGAAQKMADTMMGIFGKKHMHWGLMLTGFFVGIPLFYSVGFVLLVPLVFTIAYQHRLPVVYCGLPLIAALSVTHGLLPPHPAPVALAVQFNADMGRTLVYAFAVAIPTIIVAGPIFATRLRHINAVPLQTFLAEPKPSEALPGAWSAFGFSLMPVLLIMAFSGLESPGFPWLPTTTLKFLGDPDLVMLVSLLTATWFLGISRGIKIKEIMDMYADAIKDIAMILLILAGAGALKEVLSQSGISEYLALQMQEIPAHPLVLGWLMAAFIRICVGSATVAALTAAGIMAPTLSMSGVQPELMVLSIGAGSLIFSHFNDTGFWLFKEYFNLSIKDTLLSWSLMETIIAITGLAVVLLLNLIL
ncbi:MAG: TRAP transporter large permease subunit [Cyclobacteriaceae bacterium]|nr:TRAP transporter large permease subunit [Cyclobacteriaceae bacterium]